MMALVRTGVLVLLFACGPFGPPAAADEREISWVSSRGLDSNDPCSEKSPCRTFMVAQARTRSGGIIMCQDSGDFDEVGIGYWVMKPITIDCTGHSAKIGGIFMHGRACPSCFVEGPLVFPDGPKFIAIFRGLTIYGQFDSPFTVEFTVGAAMHIENSTISGFVNRRFGSLGKASAIGIHFAPTTESRLHVVNTVISANGNAPGDQANPDGGIVVRPTAAGAARVFVSRTQVHQNTFGIVADGRASTGGIAMTVSDSVSGGNLQDGVLAIGKAGQGPIRLTLERTRVLNNDTNGVRSSGPNVVVRVTDSVVTGSSRGLAFDTGGALLTAGNNLVEGNAANGAFSGSLNLK